MHCALSSLSHGLLTFHQIGQRRGKKETQEASSLVGVLHSLHHGAGLSGDLREMRGACTIINNELLNAQNDRNWQE